MKLIEKNTLIDSLGFIILKWRAPETSAEVKSLPQQTEGKCVSLIVYVMSPLAPPRLRPIISCLASDVLDNASI